MPEPPPSKITRHPFRRAPEVIARVASAAVPYAELQTTTNFSFLTGASHPEEMVHRAAELGHRAIGIADRNSLAGIVRAHVAAKEVGLPLAVGCRLVMHSGEVPRGRRSRAQPPDLSVLVYPTDREAYGRLCRLLTLGKRRAPKGECLLSLDDLLDHQRGLLAIALPPRADARPRAPVRGTHPPDFVELLRRLADTFDDGRLSLGASALFGPDDIRALHELDALSAREHIPLVAVNDVHYHVPERRPLQDVLTCIRHACTLDEAGLRLFPHAERHLKTPDVMARLFASHPAALARAVEIAERASAFDLDELRYRYPSEVCQPGRTAMESLVSFTWQGAAQRYPGGVPDEVRRLVEHEFALIDELEYAPYFLTVYDLVAFARSRGILCQGRGAAANSAVCYCLGITSVDPDRIDLLFERFVSKERDEPPDIDLDVEHERREELIQYLYARYGRDRAALTAEVITYRGRSAIRDVGKALGLSLDCVDRLAREIDWWSRDVDAERLRALGLDPDDRTLRLTLARTREILGFPRHLSQHVGGFVITEGLLSELVPIENASMPDRTVIEWDKDDIDAMGMLKVDVLGLGMLTCVRKAFELIEGPARDAHAARPAHATDCSRAPRLPRGEGFALHTIPPEDPRVYDMICEADTVGVFQIESRAQMSMLPRLRPRSFYDLVIEVAIVRPGPIQGDMVHPYLRRRNGEERVGYPSEAVRRVLGKTLGVPLFQEQAMALAMVAANFTPGEADQLRRAMAAWRRKGDQIEVFRERLITGLRSNGYSLDFAERFFQQIKGFSEYGFPESHAASFALLVYVSAWLKRHHPAAFAAALVNSQPMGFYAPAQIVRDAREHGLTVLPIDVGASRWDCTLEPRSDDDARGDVTRPDVPKQGARRGAAAWGADGPAIRLGMRLVKGLSRADADAVAAAVEASGPFEDVETLHAVSGVGAAALRRLAAADAFRSMGLDRQLALWQVRALCDRPAPLLDHAAARRRTAGAGHERDHDEEQDQVSHARSDGPPDRPLRTEPEKAVARPALPHVSPFQDVLHDYASHRLSLKAHPLSFFRAKLDARGVTPAAHLLDEARCPHRTRVRVAGIVLVRQRPATAGGIIFMTLEDETGTSNLVVHTETFERHRRAARHGVVLLVDGLVDRAGRVVHVIARRIDTLDTVTGAIAARSRDFH